MVLKSVHITWTLVRDLHSGTSSQPDELETSGHLGDLYFNKLFTWMHTGLRTTTLNQHFSVHKGTGHKDVAHSFALSNIKFLG
jgi:hypothetical protein